MGASSRFPRPVRGWGAGEPYPDRSAAFTLVELMVVLAILGVVLGLGSMGLSALARRPAMDAAVGQVTALLRRARNAAVSRGGAVVEVSAHNLEARTWEPVGTWRFGGDGVRPLDQGVWVRGAGGLEGTGTRVWPDPDGRYGAGLYFAPDENGGAFLDFGESRFFGPSRGLFLDLWVCPLSGGTGRAGPLPLVSAGDAYALGVTADGSVQAELALDTGRLAAVSFPRVVRPDRWVHLAMSYDGRRLSVLADGMEVAGAEGRGLMPGQPVRMVLGSDQPFQGLSTPPGDASPGQPCLLDEFHFRVLGPMEGSDLPGNVELACSQSEIRFGRDGGLDTGVHNGPVVLDLTVSTPPGAGAPDASAGPRKVRIQVETAGEVRVVGP